MKAKYFGVAYWVVCIVQLGGLLFHQSEIAAATKVMLMPLLLATYIGNLHHRPDFMVVFALIFSLAGDILLLQSAQHAAFFLFGLIGFFLAHCSYITVFVRSGRTFSWDKTSLVLTGFAVLNLSVLLKLLMPFLDAGMKIPVIAYAIILSSVLVTSLFQRAVMKADWIKLVLGILLFILSDSLIAFGRFRPELLSFLPFPSFWVMLTYILAQWLIVVNLAKRENDMIHT